VAHPIINNWRASDVSNTDSRNRRKAWKRTPVRPIFLRMVLKPSRNRLSGDSILPFSVSNRNPSLRSPMYTSTILASAEWRSMSRSDASVLRVSVTPPPCLRRCCRMSSVLRSSETCFSMRSGGVRVRLWTDRDIKRVRKELPGIKNGRSKRRPK
jgi:hypothetical protein